MKTNYIHTLKKTWQECTGVREHQVDYNTWRNTEYGIPRMEGLLTFMEADDWSERLPEMAEWCYKIAKMRNMDFNEIYPDMDWLEWYLKT